MAKYKPQGDMNERAKKIVDIATGDFVPPPDKRNPNRVKAQKKNGVKGGTARAKSLSPERRSEIATKAIKTRWAKKKSNPST